MLPLLQNKPSAVNERELAVKANALSPELLKKMNAYWRAANYLSVGLREHLPDLKVRVINVVDLMKLQSSSEHPHGLKEADYDSLFTKDKHIIFGFHGYRGWSTGSPTAEPTAICTTAAIRKRAPSRRPST